MSIQWAEVDPAQFDTYPGRQHKEPDDLDRVMDALCEGKTVELTVDGESAVRGRRMALGRRAKARGFAIEMRYQDDRIIVRRSADSGTTTQAPKESQPAAAADDAASTERPRRSARRQRGE